MDPKRRVERIQEIILGNPPDTSINQLARLCLEEDIPVSKDLIAQVRRQCLEGRKDSDAGQTIRIRWAEDLMLQQPQLTSTDIQAAMLAVFGIGVDSRLVSEALKAVRELNGMRYISRRRADPLLHDTYLAAQAVPRKPPDPNSPRLIEYLVDGQARYQTTTLGQLQATLDKLSDTYDIATAALVQVWRLTKTSVRWSARIEEEEEQ
jgi:hypothetical protein